MGKKSYEYLEKKGMDGFQFKTPQDLLDAKDILFDVIHQDGKPVAFNLKKVTQWEIKSVGSGSDQTKEGGEAAKSNAMQLHNLGYYSELSDGAQKLATAKDVPLIPDSEVEAILGKKVTPIGDGFRYERMITGLADSHIEAMFRRSF